VKPGAARSPLTWLGALLALYLVVPLVGLVFRLQGTPQRGFHVPGLGAALATSVETATISTAIIGFFGIPLAYALVRHRGRVANLVGIAVQLPLALPPVMSGILLIYLVGPYTLLGRAFGGRLTDSLAGVVLAQTFVAAPFLIVAARSAFANVEPALVDVAATLGRGEWSRFCRVSLPLAASGIGAGLLLAWLRAFGEFGATVIVAYHPYTLPVFTYVQFSGTGLPDTIAPTTLAVVTACIVLGLAQWRPRRRAEHIPTIPAACHRAESRRRSAWTSTSASATFGSRSPIRRPAPCSRSSGHPARARAPPCAASPACSVPAQGPSASAAATSPGWRPSSGVSATCPRSRACSPT
jgi:molybdate transport system permease protein